MSKGMLGRLPLSAVRGPRATLEEMLASDDGEYWLENFNRFLRRETCWLTTESLLVEGHKTGPTTRWGVKLLHHERFTFFRWNEERVSLREISDLRRLPLPGEDADEKLLHKDVCAQLSQNFKVPANVSVLDFLLKNPGLVSMRWASFKLCFWGTVYTSTEDEDARYISSLRYDEEKKRWVDRRIRVRAALSDECRAVLLEI